MKITEGFLNTLVDFKLVDFGHYSDKKQFSLLQNTYNSQVWTLWFYNESKNNVSYPIKELSDIEDLKNLYKALTDTELRVKNNKDQYVYLYEQYLLDDTGNTMAKLVIVRSSVFNEGSLQDRVDIIKKCVGNKRYQEFEIEGFNYPFGRVIIMDMDSIPYKKINQEYFLKS